MRSDATVVLGAQEQAADLLDRSEHSNRVNTAFVERTSGRVRNPAGLAWVVVLIRCNYNFVRPHQRLWFGDVTRSPAMQAGVFSRALSWRE